MRIIDTLINLMEWKKEVKMTIFSPGMQVHVKVNGFLVWPFQLYEQYIQYYYNLDIGH